MNDDRRGLFIRGGSNNHHGHDDQMAVIPYGHGMLLSGDYGYSISGTNDHVGWGTRAISHLTATINEDRPAPYMYKGWQRGRPSPAADLTGFMPTPPAQFVEMSNPGLWHHVADDVQDYRRFAAMVDVDAERYYFLDVFQIIGGNVHDYTWNAPYPNRESDDDNFTVAGIDPQARPNVWTLASLGGKHANAKWNQPGQSWGERLNGAGDGQIRDIGLNDLPKEIYKWNPPPGNGYGFIWDVKTDATQNDWTATWKLHDDKHFLRAHIINHDGMTAVTARSPSLLIDRHHHVIVARRDQPVDAQGPLRSRFVSVVEVGADDAWPVHEARKLKMEAEDANHAVAVQVDLATGDRDIFLVSRIGQTITSEAVTLQGRLGFARFDDADQLMHLAMQDGTSIEAGNWRLEIDTARFQATIRDVAADWNQSRLTIDQPLPTGTVLKGSMVLVDTPPDAAHPYSHNGYYAIEHVESAADGGSTLVFENQSLIATRLTVDTRDDTENTLHTVWPNALATMPGAHDFDGRMILKRDQPEMRTLVTDFVKRDVTVLDTQGFQPGDHLDVYVAKSGDRLEMPTTVSLTRQGNGRYLLRTNTRVTLTVTGSPGDALIAQVEGDAPRRLTSADAQGTLTATIDPAELGSASVLLSLQSR